MTRVSLNTLQNFNLSDMKELQNQLSAYKSSPPARWKENAMERQANKEWLR